MVNHFSSLNLEHKCCIYPSFIHLGIQGACLPFLHSPWCTSGMCVLLLYTLERKWHNLSFSHKSCSSGGVFWCILLFLLDFYMSVECLLHVCPMSLSILNDGNDSRTSRGSYVVRPDKGLLQYTRNHFRVQAHTHARAREHVWTFWQTTHARTDRQTDRQTDRHDDTTRRHDTT